VERSEQSLSEIRVRVRGSYLICHWKLLLQHPVKNENGFLKTEAELLTTVTNTMK
jgi:hypothetical protein